MKVILIGPSLAQRGGIVSVIQGINHFLMSKGVDVSAIQTTSDGNIFLRLVVFFLAWTSLVKNCIFNRNSIMHLHVASRGSCLRKTLLGLTCWLLRMPFIIHLHGGKFHVFYNSELGGIGRFFVRFIFQRATFVIALSDSWASWLKTNMRIGSVSVVFNGVPLSTISHCASNKIPTVLFLGRLGAGKGTDELIAAMREVSKKLPSAILELGGDGDIEHYRQQAADLPNVKFLGWVDDVGRREALARATVYCLPSWNEGLPMSVLEAMSAGLPVISTPVGGIPEAVVEGETGLLVQPGDVQGLATALSKLLLNPEMASIMGLNGQIRHRDKFSTEVMGMNCLEIYEKCLKR